MTYSKSQKAEANSNARLEEFGRELLKRYLVLKAKQLGIEDASVSTLKRPAYSADMPGTNETEIFVISGAGITQEQRSKYAAALSPVLLDTQYNYKPLERLQGSELCAFAGVGMGMEGKWARISIQKHDPAAFNVLAQEIGMEAHPNMPFFVDNRGNRSLGAAR